MMIREAKSYSIVDHALLHHGYLGRLSHQSLVLYLFLVVVCDSEGKSFYATRTMSIILRMDERTLLHAQKELLQERLIAYKTPYWYVMSLTERGRSHAHSSLSNLVAQITKKREELYND